MSVTKLSLIAAVFVVGIHSPSFGEEPKQVLWHITDETDTGLPECRVIEYIPPILSDERFKKEIVTKGKEIDVMEDPPIVFFKTQDACMKNLKIELANRRFWWKTEISNTLSRKEHVPILKCVVAKGPLSSPAQVYTELMGAAKILDKGNEVDLTTGADIVIRFYRTKTACEKYTKMQNESEKAYQKNLEKELEPYRSYRSTPHHNDQYDLPASLEYFDKMLQNLNRSNN
jgi:hypothetical protein